MFLNRIYVWHKIRFALLISQLLILSESCEVFDSIQNLAILVVYLENYWPLCGLSLNFQGCLIIQFSRFFSMLCCRLVYRVSKIYTITYFYACQQFFFTFFSKSTQAWNNSINYQSTIYLSVISYIISLSSWGQLAYYNTVR